MHAGHGQGRVCTGCGEIVGRAQIEWEAVYEDGRVYYLHLSCAAVWDAERQRRAATDTRQTRDHAQAVRERARMTSKESGQLRERADLLAREAEAVIEESKKLRRGPPPDEVAC